MTIFVVTICGPNLFLWTQNFPQKHNFSSYKCLSLYYLFFEISAYWNTLYESRHNISWLFLISSKKKFIHSRKKLQIVDHCVKGECHEIFGFRFFSGFPQAPENPKRAGVRRQSSRRYHGGKSLWGGDFCVNPLVTTFFFTDLAQTYRKCLKWPKNKLTFQIYFLKLKIKKFFWRVQMYPLGRVYLYLRVHFYPLGRVHSYPASFPPSPGPPHLCLLPC